MTYDEIVLNSVSFVYKTVNTCIERSFLHDCEISRLDFTIKPHIYIVAHVDRLTDYSPIELSHFITYLDKHFINSGYEYILNDDVILVCDSLPF